MSHLITWVAASGRVRASGASSQSAAREAPLRRSAAEPRLFRLRPRTWHEQFRYLHLASKHSESIRSASSLSAPMPGQTGKITP
jgi:hypothetical protein